MQEKDPLLNRNSMDYIPTWDEMKLPSKLRNKLESYIEDDLEAEKVQKDYEAHIERWQRGHREKVRKLEQSKSEIKIRKLLGHWFSTLPPGKVAMLIDDTRHMADEIMDMRQASASASWEIGYIEKLRTRVKKSPITVEVASIDKLKRFPHYDAINDSLAGSHYAFYRMWAHVFKSEVRMKGQFNSKK